MALAKTIKGQIMETLSVTHSTFTIEREYAASPQMVFAAWASPEARRVWGAPNPSIDLIYDQADFRVGGCDVSRCIWAEGPPYVCVTRYLDIVENGRIVFTEVLEQGAARLSAALLTIELSGDGRTTRLHLTAQIAAFDGSGYDCGLQKWLDAGFGKSGCLCERQKETAAGLHGEIRSAMIRQAQPPVPVLSRRASKACRRAEEASTTRATSRDGI